MLSVFPGRRHRFFGKLLTPAKLNYNWLHHTGSRSGMADRPVPNQLHLCGFLRDMVDLVLVHGREIVRLLRHATPLSVYSVHRKSVREGIQVLVGVLYIKREES